MKHHSILGASLILGAALMGGCYNGQLRIDGRPVGQLQVPGTSDNMQQDDVPVPHDFVLDTKNSFAHNDGFRSVTLVYTTEDGHIDDVANFYLSQMPLARWQLIRDVGTFPRRLFFEKNREECVILIQSQGPKAKLHLEIHPQRT